MSKSEYTEVIERAFKKKAFEANDFPLGPVTMTLRDGSFFCWYGALVCPDKPTKQVYVFTEHYGYHAFEDDEIIWYSGPKTLRKPKASRR